MNRTGFAIILALAIAGLCDLTVASAATPQVNQPARIADMAAPTILVPPSSIGLDLCLGEASGAYGSSMLAITLSGPVRDRDCSDLRLSKWALDLAPGHPALAYQIACASQTWRQADAVTERRCLPLGRSWWRLWR